VSGTRFAVAGSLWPDLFPSSPPLPVARLCSETSQVLQVCPTSTSVHHRRSSLDFPMRPKATAALANLGSPGSHARCLRTCSGSLTARDSGTPRDIGAPDGPSAFSYSVGVPEEETYAAEYPARTFPCQRFDAALRAAPHDSGPMWVAVPLSYDFCIHYTSPV